MIKKLRLRIVTITMALMFLVFALLMIVVNTTTIISNNSTADDIVESYFEYVARRYRENHNDNKDLNSSTYKTITVPDKHNKTRSYAAVCYDKDWNIDEIIINSNSITESNVLDILEKINKKKTETGWIDSYRYGYFTEDDGDVCLIISQLVVEYNTIKIMWQTSLITSIVSYLTMFVVVILFSKKVTEPIADALRKQRQFITDAGHELKTPVTIISANSEVIALNYGENEWTKSIRGQTGRLNTLIEKLVDLSKLEEDGEEPVMTRFMLSDAIVDTVMSFIPVAQKTGKTITQSIEPDIEITSDEAKIRQLTAIIMDNALKYCDAGGSIKVTLHREKHCILQIENTYSKIGEASLDMFFERFYRGDNVRTGGSGYGIGLSIAKSICNVCGFHINVKQSDVDKIMFTVRF